LTETEPSRVVVEPNDKILRTLKLAIAEIGLDKFLQRTNTSPEMLEKWINGKEWVPLHIVKESCDINRKNPNAPSYSKILFECTAGASFKVIVEKEPKKPKVPTVKEVKIPPIMPSIPRVPIKEVIKPEKEIVKPKVFQQMIKIGIVLFAIPVLSVIVGFLFGGFTGAVIGAISGYIIIVAFAFIFHFRRPRKA
jgi:hypothetical protein